MEAQEREPLADIDEVTTYFGIPKQTIYDQRHRGVGVGALGIRVGRHLKFRWSDIDRYIAEQQRATAAA